MTQAFIVHIEEDDPLAGPSIAEDIRDALESHGFVVTEVTPWARPSVAAATLPPLGGLAGQSPTL